MEEAKPDVDVVVPCYKYAHYLEFCIGTILSQRDVEVRVLIVDDCSPDDTPAVAAKLCAADARVNYTRNEKNLGLVGSANRGVIDWARAPYTLLISADDALTPGALARAVSVMERFPEVGMTYGMALVVAETEEMTGVEDQAAFEYRVMTGADFIEQSCIGWCGVASPTALVRTSVQHKVGGLDPKLPHTCDMEIWMRLATQSSVAAVNATQAYYRRHAENMSTAYMSAPLSDLREQLATAVSVLSSWGADMPGRETWLQAMKARMIPQAFWMAGIAFERGDEAAVRECVDFATQLDPAAWRSKAWLRFQAKRLLGRTLLGWARSHLNRTDHLSYTPFKHGAAFGWWPEGRRGGTLSV
jgi:glycosyltransferase involved in cell wall biosynthesis